MNYNYYASDKVTQKTYRCLGDEVPELYNSRNQQWAKSGWFGPRMSKAAGWPVIPLSEDEARRRLGSVAVPLQPEPPKWAQAYHRYFLVNYLAFKQRLMRIPSGSVEGVEFASKKNPGVWKRSAVLDVKMLTAIWLQNSLDCQELCEEDALARMPKPKKVIMRLRHTQLVFIEEQPSGVGQRVFKSPGITILADPAKVSDIFFPVRNQ